MTDTGFYLAHEYQRQGKSVNRIAKELKLSWDTIRHHLAQSRPPSSRRPAHQPPTVSPGHRASIRKRRQLVKRYHGKKVVVERCHTNIRGPKAKSVQLTRREFPSCLSIARKLAESHGITVNTITVRRDLGALGARARRRPKAPRLRVGDNERRLSFCHTIRQHPVHCSKLLFSDEKFFDCNDHGCVWEWILPGESVEPLGRDRWAPKVHVWGLIGIGVKVLVVLPRKMITGEVYRDKCLKPNLKLLKKRVLMQDGARAHASGLVGTFLEEQKVQVLKDWPARSPDLNPLENFWGILARKVSDCGPTNEDDLERFIKKVWRAYPQSEVDTLVNSFSDRIDQCIVNGGKKVK